MTVRVEHGDMLEILPRLVAEGVRLSSFQRWPVSLHMFRPRQRLKIPGAVIQRVAVDVMDYKPAGHGAVGLLPRDYRTQPPRSRFCFHMGSRRPRLVGADGYRSDRSFLVGLSAFLEFRRRRQANSFHALVPWRLSRSKRGRVGRLASGMLVASVPRFWNTRQPSRCMPRATAFLGTEPGRSFAVRLHVESSAAYFADNGFHAGTIGVAYWRVNSGTTGMACMAEGFNAILCEREDRFVADIKRRIAHVKGEDGDLFAGTSSDTPPQGSGHLRPVRGRKIGPTGLRR